LFISLISVEATGGKPNRIQSNTHFKIRRLQLWFLLAFDEDDDEEKKIFAITKKEEETKNNLIPFRRD